MAAAKNRWQSGLPSPLPLRTFATSLTSRDKPNLSGLEFQNEWPPPPPSNETPTERSLRLEREELARKKSQEIDAVIEEARLQREHRRSQRKVLLLGRSQSGKSTLLKSFQLQYAPQAFHAEAEAWRAVIYLNLLHCVNILLDVVDVANARMSKTLRHLQVSLSPLRQVVTTLSNALACDPIRGRRSGDNLDLTVDVWRSKRLSGISMHSSAWRSLAKVSEPGNASQEEIENARSIIMACRNDIVALWSNEDVHRCLREQAVVLDSQAIYFLNEADRISSPDYIPIDDDILRARLETFGIEEHCIVFETVDYGQEWVWYDIAGHKTSRPAWVPYFDDVHTVMFVCSLADFDDEVEDSSKFEENLRLWRSVCENKLLANTVFFLFLNKSDLLEAKLKAGIFFASYVEAYGHRLNERQAVSQYYKENFIAIHRDFSPQPRLLQVHIICAIDTYAMSNVFEQARQAILTASMDGIYPL